MNIQQAKNYASELQVALECEEAISLVPEFAKILFSAWKLGNVVFICGNGGSAANASHMANDFIYGAGIKNGGGLKVEALTANTAILTCLANDVGYDSVFSEQIKVKASKGDVLVVLSGSGNSSNVVKALEEAKKLQMHTVAILGFTGGKCKDLADVSIHFDVNDMQIAEDLQLIVGHMCMQWLCEQKL